MNLNDPHSEYIRSDCYSSITKFTDMSNPEFKKSIEACFLQDSDNGSFQGRNL